MKILPLLSFVQLCKFYSQYGMRALLVLFMIDTLQFSDSRAFGVNAVFCGLIELGGIFGGILADRYLGHRRAVIMGSVLLAVGYGSLLLENALFLSLGLIVLGGSLFASNITAILGSAYSENDPQRERGFTIFYMMQNAGALISTFLCGIIATQYGFKTGFAVAALGMVCGLIVLLLKRNLLPQSQVVNVKRRPFSLFSIFLVVLGVSSFAISAETAVLPLLPWLAGGCFVLFAVKLLRDPDLPQVLVRKLLIYLGALILFYAAGDQICSSLIVFAERETDRILFGWTIPSSIIMSFNPVVIILCGTFIAKLRIRLLTPFALVAIAFGSLSLLCLLQLNLSIFGVIGMVAIVSVAELMIGPVVSAVASEVAAKGKAGMVMGMVPVGYALASLLGGGLSKMVAVQEGVSSLTTYGLGFGKIALLMLGGGFVLQFLIKRYSYAKSSVS